MLGAALAMVVVISTLTFGTSLHTLVSRPGLYGWNWDTALSGGNGVGAIPAAQAATLLDHDPGIAAWTGFYFGTVQLDSVPVPGLAGSPNASVGPPHTTPNRDLTDPADELRRPGPPRPTSSRDRQLPLDEHHTDLPRRRARHRRDLRARTPPHPLRSTPTTRPRAPQDPRIHPPP